MCVNYITHISSKIYDKSSKSRSLQQQFLFCHLFASPSSFGCFGVPKCLGPVLDRPFAYFLAVLEVPKMVQKKRDAGQDDGRRTNGQTHIGFLRLSCTKAPSGQLSSDKGFPVFPRVKRSKSVPSKNLSKYLSKLIECKLTSSIPNIVMFFYQPHIRSGHS